jgi:hypothetical protein
LLLSWGTGEKCEPGLDAAADDMSSRDVDDSKPERGTVEKSVEVSRKEKQVALVLISVLLAMFVLAIVLLSWHDMS